MGNESGYISIFFTHIGFTIHLSILNKRARKNRYYKYQNHRNESSLATRLIPLGTVMLVYIIFHLLDFSSLRR